KYDGRYAPRPGTFHLLARLQVRQPRMRAFYGMDLHWEKQHRGLFMLVRRQAPASAEILEALARGDYLGMKGDLELPSSGHLPASLLANFARAHARSERLRKAIKFAKSMVKRSGVHTPATLKAHLRRIF